MTKWLAAVLAWAFPVALLAQVPAAAGQPKTELANIGGTMLSLPVPAGFVQVPPGHMLATFGERITAPGNRLLGYFVLENDLKRFGRSETGFERYFMVQTNQAVEGRVIPPEDFVQLRNLLRTQQAELLKRLAPKTAEIARDIGQNLTRDVGMQVQLQIGEIVPLGIYEEAADHITFGTMSKVQAQVAGRDSAGTVLCVSTVARARGKLVFFYTYALYKGPADVEWAKQQARNWTTQFARLNP
jgi:hypothetical protein